MNNEHSFKVAIVICNWNKKDDVIKCIESVKQLDYKGYDLYVVDNASTDGSVEAIIERFTEQVVIKNEQNQGGSGGFNTGMKYAVEKGIYKYIYLLDNDVIVDRLALSKLVEAMEADTALGIAGSKIYTMSNPKQLQELGSWIDWKSAYISPNKKGFVETEPITDDVDVDYVPACSLLVRVESIQKVGLMDEGYFLYWDDIEWGHRMKLAGYKVKAVVASMVWHKMGVANKISTVTTYYFWRNRLHFFNKYLAENREHTLKRLFEDFFQGLYTCLYYKKSQTARSMYEGIKDTINRKRGKANGSQFGSVDSGRLGFKDIIYPEKQVYIIKNSYTERVSSLIANRFPDLEVLTSTAATDTGKIPVIIPSSHVFSEENLNNDNIAGETYIVDFYLNVLPNNERGKNIISRYTKRKYQFLNYTVKKYLEMLDKEK